MKAITILAGPFLLFATSGAAAQPADSSHQQHQSIEAQPTTSTQGHPSCEEVMRQMSDMMRRHEMMMMDMMQKHQGKTMSPTEKGAPATPTQSEPHKH